jgi:hypothetical protein
MTTIYLAITDINKNYYVKYVYSTLRDYNSIPDASYNKILDNSYNDISSTRPFILEYKNGKDGSGVEYPNIDILYFKFLRRDGAPIDTTNSTNIIQYFLTYDINTYGDDVGGLADTNDYNKNTEKASGLLAYGSYNILYQVSNTPVQSITASTLVSNFVRVSWVPPSVNTYTSYRIDFTLNNDTFDPVASFIVDKSLTSYTTILPSLNSYRVSVIAIYEGTEASLLSETILYTGLASVISLKDLLEYQEEISIRETLKNDGTTTPLKTIGGNTLISHSDLVRFNTIENTTESIRSAAINTPNIPLTYKSYSDYNMARIGRNLRRSVL